MAEETNFLEQNDYKHAPDVKRQDFPHNFMFGVGTSAHQVEGAWNRDGKGLSIWDCFTQRHPDKIKGGANACVTADNYSRMKEDVQLLKKMGVSSYRFSIAWSRILPGGKVSMGTNMEGINHYNKLIDELLANDIEPFVTLFHYDLPNALEEEYMGFLSSKIVDDFVNYANICFWEFGDRVKNWATLNEPHIFTYTGYVLGVAAPGRGSENEDGDPQAEPYIVAYNLLNCHAAVYRKYQEDYKSSQKGRVGITLDCTYFQPYDGSSHGPDIQAIDYAYDFTFGWFMEPLTKGTWPESMQRFAITATPEHPNGRILPKFSIDQQKSLIGSYDFLGINYYTANFVQYQDDPSDDVPLGYETDGHYKTLDQDSKDRYIGEPAYEGATIYLCPKQLTELLVLIKKKYNITKDIIITENGSPDKNEPGKTYEEVCNDTFRINYIKQHLNAIKIARRNKVNVTGYFAWSFMDSFEWVSGYTHRFGMIYVDFMKNLQRYPKKSAIWYKKFLCEDKKVDLKRNMSEQGNEVTESSNKAEQAIEASKKLKKSRT